MEEIYHTISWDEIKTTTKLANNKAPELNVVSSNAFKALDDINISCILIFYNQFCNSQADFGEWHKGQVVPVPKKGDTSVPNKWIGFTLMDIINNIHSSIMCGQLFKIIIKHGVKCQFGSTPRVVCQDGTLTI